MCWGFGVCILVGQRSMVDEFQHERVNAPALGFAGTGGLVLLVGFDDHGVRAGRVLAVGSLDAGDSEDVLVWMNRSGVGAVAEAIRSRTSVQPRECRECDSSV